jgi:RNA polymerase-interacting CarD/CdnL/TRCF family regulator
VADPLHPRPYFAPGGALRYRGIGAGIVGEEIVRDFEGEKRVFLSLTFPHRGDMTIQVPLGDPSVEERLEPVWKAKRLRALLLTFADPGEGLARTYEERSAIGDRCMKEGGPEEWAALLRAYAGARRGGMLLTDSDGALLRSLQEQFAAELSCSAGDDFALISVQVRDAYRAAARPEA